MKKENLLRTLIFAALMLLPFIARAQTRDIYGWLRFDSRNQDKYGICKFNPEDPGNIKVIYPHDQSEVACAGAFADNKYYVYLYRPGDDGAIPISFNYVDLATGLFKQVADYTRMPTLYSDMTYDYSTKTMYALGKTNSGSTLLKVNLSTGEYMLVGNMDRLYITLACSYEGDMYAVDGNEGTLWKVNKETGTTTGIGATYEIPATYLQSMEFDHETNVLYWAAQDTRDNGFLSTIDVTTGESTWVGTLGNDAQVVGLYIPFKKAVADAPEAISGLKIIPGANGSLSANLSWTNPSLTFSGAILSSLTKIQIYRNEELIHEINNPVIGGKSNWTDNEMENGFSTYRVTAVNEKGKSIPETLSLFIGHDLAAAPSEASLTIIDKNSAKITWTAPSTGMNGGWIDAASLSYKIIRLPDSIVVSKTTTVNEFTDTSIPSLNNYLYEIQSITSDGNGDKVKTKSAVMGPSLSVPYTCDFATDEIFALWKVIDANNDSYTWRRETTLKAAQYYYNKDGITPGNDWLISSPIHLEKDKVYRLNFKLQSYDVDYPEKVGVYLGKGNTITDQTYLLGEYVAESNNFTGHKIMLPGNLEAGDYHISFHCHSDPEMFILYLTDLLLEEISEGSASGTVTDDEQNGLEGVAVTIKELNKKVVTDVNGNYQFDEVKTGSYTLSFSKTGYQLVERDNVNVEFGEVTITNVFLNHLQAYSVTGKVSNINGKSVGNAKIYLNGYINASATTDENGTFAFPSIFQADGYRLIGERYGLCNDTISFDIKDNDITLNIILRDKPIPPYLLKATLEQNKITLNWDEPMDTRLFKHDNGMHDGRLGTPYSTVKSVYGSVFRTPAKLTGMTWFTENYLVSHSTVNIFVFDLNEEGEPTSTLLYSRQNVPNTDLQWTTFEFPAPVDAPNGYMLALSYDGHVGLGLDNGKGPNFPFTPHINCYAEDYTTGKFTYTEEHDIKRTLMIRGIGIIRGENELPSATSDKKYAVWRLTEEEMGTPEKWLPLTSEPIAIRTYSDIDWTSQKQGFYRYAVKTMYNNGEEFSNAAFTQTLMKDMLTSVTVNVTTNTPQYEAKGAYITLTNSDEDPDHVYTGVVKTEGKVLFENVRKGKYEIQVSLKGFEKFLASDQNFSTENKYETGSLVLKEYIVNPFNLEIAKTAKDGERIFNWNVVNYLFDDFESHADFAVNSPGNVGWTYVDDDGKKTYGIDNVKFQNSNEPKAYIIFNPYKTDPNSGYFDKQIRSYSGEKYLASFPANPGPNNDFIISPKLNFNKDFTLKFYAKSYTEEYGHEQMNVGYSTTGNDISDFIWFNGTKPVDLPMGNWKEYKYIVPAEAKYVTINCISNNVFIFMVDDLFVGIELPEGVDLDRMKENISFEVYLDGRKLGVSKSAGYVFDNLSKGKHKAGVKAVFSSETTTLVETEFDVEEGNSIGRNEVTNWIIAPNPAKDWINISGEYDYLVIYNVSGVELLRHQYEKQISVKDWTNGVYFIKIVSGSQSHTFKLMINKN